MRVVTILLLVFITELTFGQNTENSKIKFIKVEKTVSCPVVPFADIQTEISNYQICHRNILPPRTKMKSEQLAVYDSWDKKPKFQAMEKSDFDSIVNFIMTSGILNTNLSYTEPDTTGGLVVLKMGACSEYYVIETSLGKVDLPLRNASAFEIPVLLEEFDVLFQRIINKYNK